MMLKNIVETNKLRQKKLFLIGNVSFAAPKKKKNLLKLTMICYFITCPIPSWKLLKH